MHSYSITDEATEANMFKATKLISVKIKFECQPPKSVLLTTIKCPCYITKTQHRSESPGAHRTLANTLVFGVRDGQVTLTMGVMSKSFIKQSRRNQQIPTLKCHIRWNYLTRILKWPS